jgi:hypothetical protein
MAAMGAAIIRITRIFRSMVKHNHYTFLIKTLRNV